MSDLATLELSPTSHVLAIAPHPDDIALSCGGLMRRLSSIDVTVLTCFNRSLYAPFANGVELSAETVRGIRTAEDREYARRIGATYVDLSLDDVSLRFSEEEDWVCSSPIKDAAYVNSCAKIAEAISSVYTHILCPLAVGANVDHIITRNAVQRGASDQRVFYYEDLPYGVYIGGPTPVAAHAATVIATATSSVIDVTATMDAKLADIAIYKSQIDPEDVTGIIQYGSHLAGGNGFAERVWFRLS
jgi:LmbE family N-acetylglucosaminyl deacetylase